MTFPKARLAVAACLLVGWLLYLGFLVYQSRDVAFLSKPQFMKAELYVVVELTDGTHGGPAPDVTVEKVLWSADAADRQLAGKRLHIANIAACAKENGYKGEGKYLVPLKRPAPDSYLVVSVPRFDEPIRIYPWTPEAEAQLNPLIAAKKGKSNQ